MRKAFGLAVALIAAIAVAQTLPTARQIAEQVNSNDLKADVSFLASDALEGRATPSRGLDIAAEYIAAQFRRVDLEPAGDNSYFQTAPYVQVQPVTEGLALTLTIDGRKFVVDKNAVVVLQPGPLNLDSVPAMMAQPPEETAPAEVTPGGTKFPSERYDGKVVIAELRNMASVSRAKTMFLILFSNRGVRGAPSILPSGAMLKEASGPSRSGPPVVFISDQAAGAALREAKDAAVTVSAHIPAAVEERILVRNVVGVLRGSDPVLKNTCVVVSAHYDHTGMGVNASGDNIFNGANDDASGTAGVIAIAKVLSAQELHPKRSVVFAAFFGEERGELGSRYYVTHPVFPISKTIADINLEQIGRTDSTEGLRLLQFNLTGYDYTSIPWFFEQAGQNTSVRAVKDAANTEQYFDGSDNISFANAGVPSTTISVTYQFSDYHGVGDEWQKLDYENMSKVTGAIAAGVFRLANSDEAPQWNADNPKTAPYVKARETAGK